MPTTSASRPSMASSTPAISSRSTSPTSSANPPKNRTCKPSSPPRKNSPAPLPSPASTARSTSPSRIERIANKFFLAIKEAGKIYHHIEKPAAKKISSPKSPWMKPTTPNPNRSALYPRRPRRRRRALQTIAPKFTGRFNKGVDYVGDVTQFEKEFNEDLAVIAFAVKKFGLPPNSNSASIREATNSRSTAPCAAP